MWIFRNVDEMMNYSVFSPAAFRSYGADGVLSRQMLGRRAVGKGERGVFFFICMLICLYRHHAPQRIVRNDLSKKRPNALNMTLRGEDGNWGVRARKG